MAPKSQGDQLAGTMLKPSPWGSGDAPGPALGAALTERDHSRRCPRERPAAPAPHTYPRSSSDSSTSFSRSSNSILRRATGAGPARQRHSAPPVLHSPRPPFPPSPAPPGPGGRLSSSSHPRPRPSPGRTHRARSCAPNAGLAAQGGERRRRAPAPLLALLLQGRPPRA